MSIDNIIQVIAGLVITGMFGWIATKLNHLIKRLLLDAGVVALHRAEILDRYRAATDRGAISLSEFDTIEKLYATYCALGGNGFVEGLMLEMRNLPRTK